MSLLCWSEYWLLRSGWWPTRTFRQSESFPSTTERISLPDYRFALPSLRQNAPNAKLPLSAATPYHWSPRSPGKNQWNVPIPARIYSGNKHFLYCESTGQNPLRYKKPYRLSSFPDVNGNRCRRKHRQRTLCVIRNQKIRSYNCSHWFKATKLQKK